MSFTFEQDRYIVASPERCDVVATNDQVASEIWFKTPALDKYVIENIKGVQLETKSHDQGWADNPEAGIWSWFDIIVLDENASMLDPDPKNKCKVFVVSGQSQNLSASAEHFRTYPTKFPDPFTNCTIWQAARATSAAPTYLPPIKINDTEFVDGGIRFNNPSILLMGEVNAVFGIDDAGFGIARHIDCLLSIGTGRAPNIKINSQPGNPVAVALYAKSIAEASIKVMTDCQTTADLMNGLFYGKEDVYYRFNAGVQVGNDWAPLIALDDYQDMPQLVTLTQTYLLGQATRVAQCATTLVH
ncbi:hypothetical protein H0H93_016474 [Arthromyces matolae]|nr:hypothetical protein H0H93_016474 [Arthromyces matolae]